MFLCVKYCACLQLFLLEFWGIPGSSVVTTQHFYCGELGSIPGQGTKILQAVLCSEEKKLQTGKDEIKLFAENMTM